MTDFITTRSDVHGVLDNLTPSEIRDKADRFLSELNDLGCLRPTILTFGEGAHRLVHDNVPLVRCPCTVHRDWHAVNGHGLLIPLPHYADWRYSVKGTFEQEVWSRLFRYGHQRV